MVLALYNGSCRLFFGAFTLVRYCHLRDSHAVAILEGGERRKRRSLWILARLHFRRALCRKPLPCLFSYHYFTPLFPHCYHMRTLSGNANVVKLSSDRKYSSKQKGIYTCRVCTCCLFSWHGINVSSFLPFRPFSMALVAESFSPTDPYLLPPTCSSATSHIPPWLLKDCQVGKHWEIAW